MTLSELVDTVSKITYKPGFRLRALYRPDMVALELFIEAERPDSREWTKSPVYIPIVYSEYLPLDIPVEREKFLHFIRQALIKVEIHEIDEWFRYEGKHIYNPHPTNENESKQI